MLNESCACRQPGAVHHALPGCLTCSGDVLREAGPADLLAHLQDAQPRHLGMLAQRGVQVVHIGLRQGRKVQGAHADVKGRHASWRARRAPSPGKEGRQVGEGDEQALDAAAAGAPFSGPLAWWCFVWCSVMVCVSTYGCRAKGARPGHRGAGRWPSEEGRRQA